jgi:hypothetical protein
MDYKQKNILNTIYRIFHIRGKKIIFVQHRNLKEFRYFTIEKINPNHKIRLYGKLKRKHVKDNHFDKIINVGEIIISFAIFLSPFIDILINMIFCYVSFLLLYDLINSKNPLEALNVNWNRGFTKFRENSISS